MLKEELEFLYKNLPPLQNEKLLSIVECKIDGLGFKGWEGIACIANDGLVLSSSPGLFSDGKSTILPYNFIIEVRFESNGSIILKTINNLKLGYDELSELRLIFSSYIFQNKLNYVNFLLHLIGKIFSLINVFEDYSFFLFKPTNQIISVQKAIKLLNNFIEVVNPSDDISSVVFLFISALEVSLENKSYTISNLKKIRNIINTNYYFNYLLILILAYFDDKYTFGGMIKNFLYILNQFKKCLLENKIIGIIENLILILKLYYLLYSGCYINKFGKYYFRQILVYINNYSLLFQLLTNSQNELLRVINSFILDDYENLPDFVQKEIIQDLQSYQLDNSILKNFKSNFTDFNLSENFIKIFLYLKISFLEKKKDYFLALDLIKNYKNDYFLMLVAAKLANEANYKPNWLVLPQVSLLENLITNLKIDLFIDVVDYLVYSKNYELAEKYINFIKSKQEFFEFDNLNYINVKIQILEEEWLLFNHCRSRLINQFIGDNVNNIIKQNLWILYQNDGVYWFLKKIFIIALGLLEYNQQVKGEVLINYVYNLSKLSKVQKFTRYTEIIETLNLRDSNNYNSNHIELDILDMNDNTLLERLNVFDANLNLISEVRNMYSQITHIITIKKHPFTIAVFGEYNTGKSTFINALLKENILPVGRVPTTSFPCVIRYSNQKLVIVHYKNTEFISYHGVDELCELLDQRRISKEQSYISFIELLLPNKLLEKVSIIDLPGINSLFFRHEELSKKFLKLVDEVWWIFNANQLGKENEIKFIQQNLLGIKEIYGFINHFDEISSDEKDEVYGFFKEWFSKFGKCVTCLSSLEAIKNEEVRNDWDEWLNPMLANACERRKAYFLATLNDVIKDLEEIILYLSRKYDETFSFYKNILNNEDILQQYKRYFENVIDEIRIEINKKLEEVEKNYQEILSAFQTNLNYKNTANIIFTNDLFMLDFIKNKIFNKLCSSIRSVFIRSIHDSFPIDVGQFEKADCLLQEKMHYDFSNEINDKIYDLLFIKYLFKIIQDSVLGEAKSFAEWSLHYLLYNTYYTTPNTPIYNNENVYYNNSMVLQIESLLVKYTNTVKNFMLVTYIHLNAIIQIYIDLFSKLLSLAKLVYNRIKS